MPDEGRRDAKLRNGSAAPMLACWGAETGLDLAGFESYRLADGRSCHIWARGYFFDSAGRLRMDREIGEWLAREADPGTLARVVPNMNGCFAVVVVWPEARQIEIGLDRLAPIPIYSHVESARFLVSDDFWCLAERSPSHEFDTDAIVSMVVVGYVVRPRTLLSGISVLANAAVHRISWDGGVVRVSRHDYWSPSRGPRDNRRLEAWRQGLAETLDRIFERYGRAIASRGWTAHVPLSGGQDSRLTLGLMHRRGARPHAFSYGPSGNEESLIAFQVARALGAPFRFIPVDDPSFLTAEFVRMMTRRVGMGARFTAGLGAQLSLGDYSPTDVFLPSHPGGLVPGSPQSRVAFLVRTEEQAVQQIVDSHFLPVSEATGAALFPALWREDSKRRTVRGNWDFDAKDPLGSMHRWEWNNRHQMILAELRTYEQSGRWLLPTADYEFMDYYDPVPSPMRFEKRLYTETLLHNLFIHDLAALREIRLAFSNGFDVHPLSWRDWVVMNIPLGSLGDWLLRRATRTKLGEQRRTVGEPPKWVTGPDPIDAWWLTNPAFRASVTEMFRGWDGMGGLVDILVLMNLLQQPLPRLFVGFVIPALLTLRVFQDIVENELHHSR